MVLRRAPRARESAALHLRGPEGWRETDDALVDDLRTAVDG